MSDQSGRPGAQLDDCPMCGGPMRVLWRFPERSGAHPAVRGRGPYTLLWCDRSGFGRILPRLDVRDSIALYDDAYFSGQATAATGEPGVLERMRVGLACRIDRSRPLTPESVDLLVSHHPSSICDVGCGSGEILHRLRGMGHRVLGVDPAEPARRRAAQLAVPVIDATAEEPVNVPVGEFDVVIARHSLEHCTDPVRAFDTLAALVRPGGRLVCATPNCDSIGFRTSGSAWWHCDVPRHLSFFTARCLRAMCHSRGLQVQAVEYYGLSRQFGGEWVHAEQGVWDQMFASGAAGGITTPRRPSNTGAWLRLAKTMIAEDPACYDSVKIIAMKPEKSARAA